MLLKCVSHFASTLVARTCRERESMQSRAHTLALQAYLLQCSRHCCGYGSKCLRSIRPCKAAPICTVPDLCVRVFEGCLPVCCLLL